MRRLYRKPSIAACCVLYKQKVFHTAPLMRLWNLKNKNKATQVTEAMLVQQDESPQSIIVPGWSFYLQTQAGATTSRRSACCVCAAFKKKEAKLFSSLGAPPPPPAIWWPFSHQNSLCAKLACAGWWGVTHQLFSWGCQLEVLGKCSVKIAMMLLPHSKRQATGFMYEVNAIGWKTPIEERGLVDFSSVDSDTSNKKKKCKYWSHDSIKPIGGGGGELK